MSSHSNPPIPDSNKNGYLDGDDIRLQLSKEEQEFKKRTTSERAHGVAELTGLRKKVSEYNVKAFSGTATNSGAEFTQYAKDFVASLEDAIATAKAAAKKGVTREKSTSITYKQQGTNTATLAADKQSMYDFALSFDQTFPKGILLNVVDMPVLMAHYGQLAMSVETLTNVSTSKAAPVRSKPSGRQ